MMEAFQKSLTKIFVSKRGKVPMSMKFLSYLILAVVICFLISASLSPVNDKHNRIIEGLVNPKKDNKKPKKLIFFHMDGCGHCVKFMPKWDKFCDNPPKNIITEKLERKHPKAKGMLQEFNISGFPTIVILDENNKLQDKFKGPRTVDGLNAFCKKYT